MKKLVVTVIICLFLFSDLLVFLPAVTASGTITVSGIVMYYPRGDSAQSPLRVCNAKVEIWDEEIIKSDNMHSKGRYTPFEGITFKAIVEKTLLRGKIIADRKFPPEAVIGHGEFITIF